MPHPDQSTTDKPLVTFVCTANVCRSPWAEMFARTLTDRIEFVSAGVLANDGNPIDTVMAQTLPAGALTQHASQLLSTDLVDRSTLILTMERRHKSIIVDDWPYAERKVFNLKQFAGALEGLPRRASLDDAIRFAHHQRPSSRETGDVADPFRRGSMAARQCADELTELVTRSVEPLDAVVARGI